MKIMRAFEKQKTGNVSLLIANVAVAVGITNLIIGIQIASF